MYRYLWRKQGCDDHVICSPQDMGTVVMGKVESGGVMKGASLLLMPNRVSQSTQPPHTV